MTAHIDEDITRVAFIIVMIGIAGFTTGVALAWLTWWPI